MDLHDQFGYPLPSGTAGVSNDWNDCVTAFLAHGKATPGHLEAVLAGAPAFSLALSAKGLFLALLARRELAPAMRAAHDAALASAGDARERAYAEALGLALSGRLGRAADRLDAALAAWPRDALAMKLVHALRFMTGDAIGMRRSVEAVLPAIDGDHPHAGFVRGCHAFALEETGDYAAAEAAGRAAVELEPRDAWGLHAVLHVFEMTGRADEGLGWIAGREGGFAHCNNFAFHIHWHVALFRLDRGDAAGALGLYDGKIRAEPTDDFRDIANAASLLARLEVEGVGVGPRWEELAELAAARAEDACAMFADLHYLLALVRAGRREEAGRLADRIGRDARTGDSQTELVCAARTAGEPAAEGLRAWADGDHAATARRLSEATARLESIGGSHAQRDVFHWLAIHAALRAGRPDEAARLLAARQARRTRPDGFAGRRLREIAAGRATVATAG